MAAGVTAESVLGSIIQGHLECSICHTRYQEPKMLDCSHSFCLKCLQELKKSRNPEDAKIMCPLCQRETILPEGGAEKLNTNYILTSLVEEVTKQEQLLAGLQQSKVICQACDEENEAISRCMDCEHYLCEECQKAHQRWAALRTHKLKSLAEFHKGGKSASKSISNCNTHPNKELCFYCNTCEQLICKLCASLSHKQPKHTHVDLKTAIDNYLQEARERISQAYSCSAYNYINTSWKSLRERLGIMLGETNKHISQTAEQKIKQIRQEEKQLKQKAHVIHSKRDKRLAEMIVAEKTVKMVHREISDDNRREILSFRQKLLHDFKDVGCEQPEGLTRNLSFIGFKKNQDEVELGTLLQEEKWELCNTSKTTGDFIAGFSNGDLVVTDTNQVIKLSPDCMVLNVFNMKEHSALAANKDDQLIVLFGSEVWTLNKEYRVLRQFTPGKEASIDSTPTCLAVDDSNLIAVGYKDKEQISLHNPDGSLIRTMPAPMIDKYMTISNQRLIIYTNSTHKTLTCVDYEGNNKFTLAVQVSEDHHSPRGVCCDPAGDVYTIVSGPKSKTVSAKLPTHRVLGSTTHYSGGLFGVPAQPAAVQAVKSDAIQHYSSGGKFIESVLRDENNSNEIAYTPDGELVVTGANSTQIYHRV